MLFFNMVLQHHYNTVAHASRAVCADRAPTFLHSQIFPDVVRYGPTLGRGGLGRVVGRQRASPITPALPFVAACQGRRQTGVAWGVAVTTFHWCACAMAAFLASMMLAVP